MLLSDLIKKTFTLINEAHYNTLRERLNIFYRSLYSLDAKVKLLEGIKNAINNEHTVKLSLIIALKNTGYTVRPEYDLWEVSTFSLNDPKYRRKSELSMYPLISTLSKLRFRPDILIVLDNDETVCIEVKNKPLDSFKPGGPLGPQILSYFSICNYVLEVSPASREEDVRKYLDIWLKNVRESYGNDPAITASLDAVGLALADPLKGKIIDVRPAKRIETLIDLRETMRTSLPILTLHEFMKALAAEYLHEKEGLSVVSEVSLPTPRLLEGDYFTGVVRRPVGPQRPDLIAFNDRLEIIGVECATTPTGSLINQLKTYRNYVNKLYLVLPDEHTTHLISGLIKEGIIEVHDIGRYVKLDKLLHANVLINELRDERGSKVYPKA